MKNGQHHNIIIQKYFFLFKINWKIIEQDRKKCEMVESLKFALVPNPGPIFDLQPLKRPLHLWNRYWPLLWNVWKNSSLVTLFFKSTILKFFLIVKCFINKCWNWRMGIGRWHYDQNNGNFSFQKVAQLPWKNKQKSLQSVNSKCVAFRKQKFCLFWS